MLRTEPLPTLEKPETSDGKTMSTSTITKGLEGVVAASSSVCYIDGDAGVLAYRGIDIHELAEKSTFEETCYLLWYGKLPDRKSTRLNSSHDQISYAVFCLKKKKK